jgi:malonyl-CoA/methylmalonyl-CoA synthetase
LERGPAVAKAIFQENKGLGAGARMGHEGLEGGAMANPLYDALFAPREAGSARFLILPGGRELTYAEFLNLANHIHALFASLGLNPGDRVALMAEKSPEALAVYAASLRAGLVFLPLNPAYTAAEARYFLADSGAALLLCDPAREADLTPAAEASGARILSLNQGFLGKVGAPAPPPADRAESDLAALLYTSGTTGRPKGAMLTQRNLLSNAEVLAQKWRFTEADTLLHALPIFHTHGLFVATNTILVAGGAMIFLPKFEAGEVLRLLPQATAMMGVPTFYTRLLGDPRLTREALRRIRLFVSGSAPLLAETHRAWTARTGHAILERYGMTETNMMASNPYAGERRPGSVGFPLPGIALRIADPATGAVLAQGEIGEIEAKGPNICKGYWRQEEKTREAFRTDGFFRTGDLGRFDAEGYLHIVGRAKDLIITGGLNVYPKEVEEVLDAVPGVAESAVIGVPHPDFGEAVAAVLVARGGETPSPEALAKALDAALAKYKQPKHIEIVADLPRNAMGKVEKAKLRAAYAGLFAPPG